MFKPTVVETPELNDAISRLYDVMKTEHPTSKEYAAIADQIVKLEQLRDNKHPKPLSADAKAALIANLAGIVFILQHERAHVLTSKAIGFISKLR